MKAQECPHCHKDGISGFRYMIASHECPAVCVECDRKFLKYYPITFLTIAICVALYYFLQVPPGILSLSPPLAALVEAKYAPLQEAPNKTPKTAKAVKVLGLLVLGGLLMAWFD